MIGVCHLTVVSLGNPHPLVSLYEASERVDKTEFLLYLLS